MADDEPTSTTNEQTTSENGATDDYNIAAASSSSAAEAAEEPTPPPADVTEAPAPLPSQPPPEEEEEEVDEIGELPPPREPTRMLTPTPTPTPNPPAEEEAATPPPAPSTDNLVTDATNDAKKLAHNKVLPTYDGTPPAAQHRNSLPTIEPTPEMKIFANTVQSELSRDMSTPPSSGRRDGIARWKKVASAKSSTRAIEGLFRNPDSSISQRRKIEKMKRNPWVLSPRKPWVQKWDLGMTLLLVYTIIMTPYEVAFLQPHYDALFVLNQLASVYFLIDMTVQCRLAYLDPKKKTYVYDLGIILRNYCTYWLAPDFLSVFPFDIFVIEARSDESSQLSKVIHKLRVVRLLRLFRLFKLLRIIRASSVFRRWESSLSINYAAFSLIKFTVFTIAIAHWMACGFMLVADLQENADTDSWIARIEADNSDFYTNRSPFDRYVTSFYWGMTTMSTIGYGDITPVTTVERIYGTLAQLIGASIFAYVVGAICGIITQLDEQNTEFYDTMDRVNSYSEEAALPHDLRIRLRNYIRYKRANRTLSNYQHVLMHLTPALRSEVVMHSHLRSVLNVPFLRYAPERYVLRLSNIMQAQTFAPSETIIREYAPSQNMYIIKKGLAASHGIIYGVGKFLGLDALHSRRPHLYRLITLTFVETFQIDRDRMLQITDEYPAQAAMVRVVAVKFMFRMHVRAYTRALKRLTSPAMTADEMFGGGCGLLVNMYYNKLKPYYDTILLFNMGPEAITAANRAACIMQRVGRNWLARRKITVMRLQMKEAQEQENRELEEAMRSHMEMESRLGGLSAEAVQNEANVSVESSFGGQGQMDARRGRIVGRYGTRMRSGSTASSSSVLEREHPREGSPDAHKPDDVHHFVSVMGELVGRIEDLENNLIHRIDNGRLKANAKLDMQIKKLRTDIMGRLSALESTIDSTSQANMSANGGMGSGGGMSRPGTPSTARRAQFKGARF